MDESGESGPSKKRKLSGAGNSLFGIKLEVVKFENEKLKEYIEKLENERLQSNKQKVLELETMVTSLQATNAELQVKLENAKVHFKLENDLLNSADQSNKEKIKILNDEKQEAEVKMRKLNEKILPLNNAVNDLNKKNQILVKNHQELFNENKNLKKEKEMVESQLNQLNFELQSAKDFKLIILKKMEEEQKNFQGTIDQMKAESKDLTRENSNLKQMAQEEKNSIMAVENKIKKLEKENFDAHALNQQLKQKNKTLETTNEKEKQEYQRQINDMKLVNAELTKKNTDLIERESNPQQFSMDAIFDGAKYDFSLLSCTNNKVLNVSKIYGTTLGWKIFSSGDRSKEVPYLMKKSDLITTCFKFNIIGELIIPYCFIKADEILGRVASCELVNLHINGQTITFCDFVKLTEAGKVEICLLEKVCIKDKDGKKSTIDGILKHLPSIKKFQYEFSVDENQLTTAKDLSELPLLPNLQKFELSNLSASFNPQDFEGFVKKNSSAIVYAFKFSGNLKKSMQKEIQKAGNKLLKSLSSPGNLSVEFK